jgi:hypothetical protein
VPGARGFGWQECRGRLPLDQVFLLHPRLARSLQPDGRGFTQPSRVWWHMMRST